MSSGNPLGTQELGNITSADIVAYATIEGVTGNTRITDFADGEGVTNDPTERAVAKKGIDGKPVYGVVCRGDQVTLTLLPTSPFLDSVNQCVAIMKKQRKGPKWTLEITYPATGKCVTWREGVLLQSPDLPAAQDVQGNVAIQLWFGDSDTQSI